MNKADVESPAVPAQKQRTGLLARLTDHIPAGQFVRYLLVGAWNTVFGYSTFAGIYWTLHHYGVPVANVYWQVITAQVTSNFINITVAFFGYKFFVFKTKGNTLREWLKSMAVYWSGFLPGVVLLPLLVRALRSVPLTHDLAPYIANALLMGVGVIYSFIGNKYVTFKVPPEKELEEDGEAIQG